MRILSTSAFTCVHVITDEEGHNEYTRFGENSWSRHYGQTLEDVHYCEALEAAYQKSIKGEQL